MEGRKTLLFINWRPSWLMDNIYPEVLPLVRSSTSQKIGYETFADNSECGKYNTRYKYTKNQTRVINKSSFLLSSVTTGPVQPFHLDCFYFQAIFRPSRKRSHLRPNDLLHLRLYSHLTKNGSDFPGGKCLLRRCHQVRWG